MARSTHGRDAARTRAQFRLGAGRGPTVDRPKGHALDLIWTAHLVMDADRLWVAAGQRPRGGAGWRRSPAVRR
jgi:hypothetical protein